MNNKIHDAAFRHLPVLGKKTVSGILEAIRNLPILQKDDISFLQEKSEHLAVVLEKTHIWRTDIQKASIINDQHFPTDHAKLHQAMLEQKVQFDQAMLLAKDFELKRLEIEEKEIDLAELDSTIRRDQIKAKKIQIEMQFMQYELKQMQIAMQYRMAEIRGWQKIQEELLTKLRATGMSEEEIWSKNDGELKALFLSSLFKLQALPTTTDSAERSNLISLALFSYQNVVRAGLLEQFKKECSLVQLDSLAWLENSIHNSK